MAYASLLSVANASYPTQASDGSYYASAQLAVSANTDLIVLFTPVISGPAAPFAIVYGVDLVGNLIPIGRVDQANPALVLGAGAGRSFGSKVQIKAYAGLSTPPIQFALSVEGKGVA
jgi:hypothetical protein